MQMEQLEIKSTNFISNTSHTRFMKIWKWNMNRTKSKQEHNLYGFTWKTNTFFSVIVYTVIHYAILHSSYQHHMWIECYIRKTYGISYVHEYYIVARFFFSLSFTHVCTARIQIYWHSSINYKLQHTWCAN